MVTVPPILFAAAAVVLTWPARARASRPLRGFAALGGLISMSWTGVLLGFLWGGLGEWL